MIGGGAIRVGRVAVGHEGVGRGRFGVDEGEGGAVNVTCISRVAGRCIGSLVVVVSIFVVFVLTVFVCVVGVVWLVRRVAFVFK